MNLRRVFGKQTKASFPLPSVLPIPIWIKASTLSGAIMFGVPGVTSGARSLTWAGDWTGTYYEAEETSFSVSKILVRRIRCSSASTVRKLLISRADIQDQLCIYRLQLDRVNVLFTRLSIMIKEKYRIWSALGINSFQIATDTNVYRKRGEFKKLCDNLLTFR